MLHKIPSLFPWKHNKTKIMAEPVLEEDVNLEEQLAPCTICGRTFLPAPLIKHAKICEKNACKKRKIFNSLKQRVEGTDLAPFHQQTYLKKAEQPAKVLEVKHSQPAWKEKHQELVTTIREAKGNTQEASVTPSRQRSMSIMSAGFERCQTCDRQFGPKAYDRHVEWCKERKNRLPQSPASVLQAKERLEARIKYRVPSMSKPKKTVKEKYQSPGTTVAVKSTSNLDRRPSIRKTPEKKPINTDKPDNIPKIEVKLRRPEPFKSSGKRVPPLKLNTTRVNTLTEGLTVSQLNTPVLAPKKLTNWTEISHCTKANQLSPKNSASLVTGLPRLVKSTDCLEAMKFDATRKCKDSYRYKPKSLKTVGTKANPLPSLQTAADHNDGVKQSGRTKRLEIKHYPGASIGIKESDSGILTEANSKNSPKRNKSGTELDSTKHHISKSSVRSLVSSDVYPRKLFHSISEEERKLDSTSLARMNRKKKLNAISETHHSGLHEDELGSKQKLSSGPRDEFNSVVATENTHSSRLRENQQQLDSGSIDELNSIAQTKHRHKSGLRGDELSCKQNLNLGSVDEFNSISQTKNTHHSELQVYELSSIKNLNSRPIDEFGCKNDHNSKPRAETDCVKFFESKKKSVSCLVNELEGEMLQKLICNENGKNNSTFSTELDCENLNSSVSKSKHRLNSAGELLKKQYNSFFESEKKSDSSLANELEGRILQISICKEKGMNNSAFSTELDCENLISSVSKCKYKLNSAREHYKKQYNKFFESEKKPVSGLANDLEGKIFCNSISKEGDKNNVLELDYKNPKENTQNTAGEAGIDSKNQCNSISEIEIKHNPRERQYNSIDCNNQCNSISEIDQRHNSGPPRERKYNSIDSKNHYNSDSEIEKHEYSGHSRELVVEKRHNSITEKKEKTISGVDCKKPHISASDNENKQKPPQIECKKVNHSTSKREDSTASRLTDEFEEKILHTSISDGEENHNGAGLNPKKQYGSTSETEKKATVLTEMEREKVCNSISEAENARNLRFIAGMDGKEVHNSISESENDLTSELESEKHCKSISKTGKRYSSLENELHGKVPYKTCAEEEDDHDSTHAAGFDPKNQHKSKRLDEFEASNLISEEETNDNSAPMGGLHSKIQSESISKPEKKHKTRLVKDLVGKIACDSIYQKEGETNGAAARGLDSKNQPKSTFKPEKKQISRPVRVYAEEGDTNTVGNELDGKILNQSIGEEEDQNSARAGSCDFKKHSNTSSKNETKHKSKRLEEFEACNSMSKEEVNDNSPPVRGLYSKIQSQSIYNPKKKQKSRLVEELDGKIARDSIHEEEGEWSAAASRRLVSKNQPKSILKPEKKQKSRLMRVYEEEGDTNSAATRGLYSKNQPKSMFKPEKQQKSRLVHELEETIPCNPVYVEEEYRISAPIGELGFKNEPKAISKTENKLDELDGKIAYKSISEEEHEHNFGPFTEIIHYSGSEEETKHNSTQLSVTKTKQNSASGISKFSVGLDEKMQYASGPYIELYVEQSFSDSALKQEKSSYPSVAQKREIVTDFVRIKQAAAIDSVKNECFSQNLLAPACDATERTEIIVLVPEKLSRNRSIGSKSMIVAENFRELVRKKSKESMTDFAIDGVEAKKRKMCPSLDLIPEQLASTAETETTESESKFSFEQLHVGNIDAVIYENNSEFDEVESFHGLYTNQHSTLLSQARLERELRNCCSEITLSACFNCSDFVTYSETDLSKFNRLQHLMKSSNLEETYSRDRILELAGEEFITKVRSLQDAPSNEDKDLISFEEVAIEPVELTMVENNRSELDKILELGPDEIHDCCNPFIAEIYHNCLQDNIRRIKQRKEHCFDGAFQVSNQNDFKELSKEINVIPEETQSSLRIDLKRSNEETVAYGSGDTKRKPSPGTGYSPRFVELVNIILRGGEDLLEITREDCKKLIEIDSKDLKLLNMQKKSSADLQSSREETYNPILTAERQLMELLECDDFKTTPKNKPHSVKETNARNLKHKRASVIDPPTDFQDTTRDIFDDNFELIENFINDNLSDDTILDKLDAISLTSNKTHITDSENFNAFCDELSIDPRLINEYDNLSIPEHLSADGGSPADYLPHTNTKLPALEPPVGEKTNANLNEMNDLIASVANVERSHAKKQPSRTKVVKTQQSCSFGNSASSHDKKKNLSSLKRSISVLDPVKPKNLRNKEDVQNYFQEQELRSSPKNMAKVKEPSVSAVSEDLFSIDDEMYEEYKRYEQMYLQEKEEKLKLERKVQEDDGQVLKICGDSAYGR